MRKAEQYNNEGAKLHMEQIEEEQCKDVDDMKRLLEPVADLKEEKKKLEDKMNKISEITRAKINTAIKMAKIQSIADEYKSEDDKNES